MIVPSCTQIKRNHVEKMKPLVKIPCCCTMVQIFFTANGYFYQSQLCHPPNTTNTLVSTKTLKQRCLKYFSSIFCLMFLYVTR